MTEIKMDKYKELARGLPLPQDIQSMSWKPKEAEGIQIIHSYEKMVIFKQDYLA